MIQRGNTDKDVMLPYKLHNFEATQRKMLDKFWFSGINRLEHSSRVDKYFYFACPSYFNVSSKSALPCKFCKTSMSFHAFA